MRGQLCQQLVRLVAYTCFQFSACKNCHVRTAMPAASQASCRFKLRKSQHGGSTYLKPVARTCFRFSVRKNRNAEPAAVSFPLHIPVFAFPLSKIITRGQLYQQLVRPVACTCFRFPLVKIVTWGQLWQQLVRQVVRMCFHFSTCKNRNARAVAMSGRLYIFSLFRL